MNYVQTQIHSTATIHPSAVVSETGVQIDEGCLIEAGVTIQPGTVVGANSIIRCGAHSGSDALDIKPMKLFHGSITYLALLFLIIGLDPLLNLEKMKIQRPLTT